MVLANSKLVPELQYWFNKALINGEINKEGIPIPVTFDTVYLPQKSFIELLFNENFKGDRFFYLYEEATDKLGWPYVARTRMMVYPFAAKYLELEDEDQPLQNTCCFTNAFVLESQDLMMLDVLLAYRNDSTSVTIIYTPPVETIYVDGTAVTTFEQLTTPLSKLIFIYIDLKRYNRTNLYSDEDLISQGTILESCFEVFLVDQMFKVVSNST
jgi:hypothetical protein